MDEVTKMIVAMWRVNCSALTIQAELLEGLGVNLSLMEIEQIAKEGE